MSELYLENIIIKNRAPFENLDLNFKENQIAVLTAVNGKGKTTILSYIVDAWHEMVRLHFPNEFKRKENKFYRVSSPIYNINQNEPSFVYIRFKRKYTENNIQKEENIDYVDIRNNCTQQQYDASILLDNKIQFNIFQNALKESNYIKQVSINLDKKKAKEIFNNNVITYFPAYRYEIPGYINDPYKIHLDFTKESEFSGYLPNPLEVVSGLSQLANWIMDVVLDMDLYKQEREIQLQNGEKQKIDITPEKRVLWNSLNTIIEKTCISKRYEGTLRFGIGKRNSGGTRISIMNDTPQGNSVQFYPTIFNLSSGEAAMLCMFGEILRQADKNRNNIALQQITGIVLIDEVDKHLHIKLQKEVLPLLFNLFPNVQFIVSSHSPFLNMGLAEESINRAKIIDLDNNGITTDATSNELYQEVYKMMISENECFAEKYDTLQEQIKQGTRPLIITEGKTDVKHLKEAKEKLNISDCDIEFHEIAEDWGDSKLKLLLEQLSKVKQNRKIIGIFDRDVQKIVDEIEKSGQSHKDYSNNVYAFCIPVPQGRENYTNISIEFYYTDDEIKKEKDGRRLYFDNEVEFRQSASNKQIRTLTRLENKKLEEEYTKKIFDEDLGNVDFAHSKAVFANLVETDEDFTNDFDFSKFQVIFDKIKEIMTHDETIN
jgi:predicted ATPase